MSKLSRPLVGWLCACGVLFIWAGWVVVSRLGVTQALTVPDMIFLRFAVATVAVLPFVRRFWPRGLKLWQTVLLGCGPGAPYLLFAFSGMQFAPASHAGILMNGTLPIFAAVAGWLWLGERPGPWRVFGMAVVVTGCVLIAWDRSSGGVGPHAWIGHLMFASAALLLGVYMVATKAWQLTAMEAMVSIPIVNFVWFAPLYAVFLSKGIRQASWSEIALQGLFQGLGPSIVGAFCFTMAVRSIGPTPTAAVMAAVPALAALAAIPVLGEWPSPIAWSGLVVATAGILFTAGWTPAAGRRRTA